MITYSNRRDNLIYAGIWRELRHLIQNWRKKIGLSLNDPVQIWFRVDSEKVTAHLTVPDLGCDVDDIKLEDLAKPNKLESKDYWLLLASGAEWLGSDALLSSVRVTNLITDEEVFWSR